MYRLQVARGVIMTALVAVGAPGVAATRDVATPVPREPPPAPEITGHAYREGTDALGISRERSLAVSVFLQQGGIDERRLTVRGEGDRLPVR
jgi:outer membrane protein OmpA-like peptidoglycan-associated protein